MRRILQAAALLATAPLGLGAAPAPELVKPVGQADILPRQHRTGLLIDLNEARLAVFGGYRGERLRKTALSPLRDLDGMRLYLRAGTEHLYADRDGDGRPDTCALYNGRSGIVSADFDCNGTGDQILAQLKPPPPIRSPEDLARRLAQPRSS